MNGTTSASFWAQKRQEVKSPDTATPNGTVPDIKKRTVLKGRSSAAASIAATNHGPGVSNGTSMPKVVDWADSDDDEEFIASFSTEKKPRKTTLESELADRDTRIETLEAAADTRDAHIAELEGIVEAKERCIVSLTNDVQDMESRIQQLGEDSKTQFLYVQELVGEVDARNRRVEQLEAELDVKGDRIRTLELSTQSQSGTSVGSMDTAMAETTKQVHSAEQATCSVTADANKVDNTMPVVLPCDTPSIASDSKEQTHDGTIEPTPPEKASKGPATNDSKFPMLWSPDMPKKVAPVEKPKVLKMAIDMSNYGKKPAAVTKHPNPSSGKASITPAGQSTKPRAKTDVVPKFQVDKDIRQMPHAERVLFANGPEITINMGATKLATLPKYVFMQCSAMAYKYFTNLPNASSMTFPAGSMDAEAAKAHIQWMCEMTYQTRVYSVTLNGDEKFDVKNLKICQAARVMGLANTYVGHFTKVLCDRVRSSNPSVEFMSSICELANPDNDPIFECLANNLVNQQMTNTSKKPGNLQKLMAKYPLLGQKMAVVEQRVKNSREKDMRKNNRSRGRDTQQNGGATY
jgi:hypothetical protein